MCFNWWKIDFKPEPPKVHIWFVLLPNADLHQQDEEYVSGCTWQLKKVKTINKFHKLKLIEEMADVNVSTLNTMGYGSRFQSDMVWSLSVVIHVDTFLLAILYIMSSPVSLPLS